MGVYDLWLDIRDKCLTSQRFHDFALRFPFTRPIVRKRQNELFDIVSGFVYSQILLACVELDLFTNDKLQSPGVTLEEFAAITNLPFDEARRLAKGAASLRLLEERNNRFRLGDLGAALSANEGVMAMVRHHKYFYKDLIDPVDMLKAGRKETNLSKYWDYARNLDPSSASEQDVSDYSKLMNASQRDVSNEVLASFNFSSYKTLMDVGGGQGAFVTNMAKANPHLNLMLFDLPEVVNLAKAVQVKNNPEMNIEMHGGSFFHDPLPKGADLISLVRILHDHDDEPVMKILASVYDALESGGTLLIAEPMSSGGAAHKISDAYFNFYLYSMASGRPRSPAELQKMLQKVGFRHINLSYTRSNFTTSLLVARK